MARPALIAIVAIAGQSLTTAPLAPSEFSLQARHAGELSITNGSARLVTIRSALGVERWQSGAWLSYPVHLQAVAMCPDPGTPTAPTTIFQPGERRTIVPWTGYNCGGQCARTCGINFYLGAGRYRFIAIRLPGGERVISNAFTMPQRPPPQVYTFSPTVR